jgi:YidC/Oxa1 family membrane protein insertase
MNFDRNTVLGFILLAVLFFGYFYYTNQEQAAYNKAKARQQFVEDSIAKVNRPILNNSVDQNILVRADSLQRVTTAGFFALSVQGVEEEVMVENELMKVVFSTRGGQVKRVELKNYQQFGDSQLVQLASTTFGQLGYTINAGNNKTVQTTDLFFKAGRTTVNADGSQQIAFQLQPADSVQATGITHIYTIKPNDYLIDLAIDLQGANQLLTQGFMNVAWQYEALKQESDIAYEKQNTQVGFIEDGNFDYFTIGNKNSVDFSKNVSWVGVRQRFFFSAIAHPQGFNGGQLNWTVPADSTGSVVRSVASLKLQLPVAATASTKLSLYYGPSDYHILKKYDYEFDKLVNLGQGIYAFVRPLNKYVIVPIFDFMRQFSFGNIGLAIVLLTLIIRLVISPLTYSSYLSGAKMKALRPEIAKLKEKFGDDQQSMSMEQMKLFREAGVNPLGGCIPALLQIPIFFALFSFFNAEISLRGAEFLWAQDLSAYDAPIRFGFHIPLFGDHLSLFNFLATATSLWISVYSMSMSPDQSNPMMKYMPYIFPVFMLFFFNNLPSALTWYYTVSNLITLVLQFVIQHYIIDHDKILAKIQENRKKPKSKSKWQERLEQMQEQQKKLKDMQDRGKR